jgi:hypothetical protein
MDNRLLHSLLAIHILNKEQQPNDNVDGNISNNIVTTGSVNTSTPGTYTVTYTVTDAASNTTTGSENYNYK